MSYCIHKPQWYSWMQLSMARTFLDFVSDRCQILPDRIQQMYAV
jgi:hypothetical protein